MTWRKTNELVVSCRRRQKPSYMQTQILIWIFHFANEHKNIIRRSSEILGGAESAVYTKWLQSESYLSICVLKYRDQIMPLLYSVTHLSCYVDFRVPSRKGYSDLPPSIRSFLEALMNEGHAYCLTPIQITISFIDKSDVLDTQESNKCDSSVKSKLLIQYTLPGSRFVSSSCDASEILTEWN